MKWGNLLIEKVKMVYKSKVKIPVRKILPEICTIEENKISEKENISKTIEGLHVGKKLIGIGTSTGGPSALASIFRCFPKDFPAPVLVVQHMPEGFTKAFAERLNSESGLNVKEAEENDKVLPGCGYIAPGHSHMRLEVINGEKIIKLSKGDKVSGHMPSIDVLFDSIALHSAKESICVIMTGMGQDGAKGILKIREKGGYTLAQDEETSVVYGMNRVAVQMGAIDRIVPLHEIPMAIVKML